MLSRLVTAFLPRTKHLLISWLKSPSTVILMLKKIKSVTWEFPGGPVVKNLCLPINAGEGVEKREPSYTVGGNAN